MPGLNWQPDPRREIKTCTFPRSVLASIVAYLRLWVQNHAQAVAPVRCVGGEAAEL